MDFFDNINLDALQPLLDIFPDGWYDDVRQLYGESLSDEMISQSVEETCDFFHIDEPVIVSEGWTTGVYPNNDFTLQDDVLIFNREQLLNMGISGKDGLDLVMTHEGTHRMLQGMDHLEFNSHQEELCCDYMAGVRAGLNDIDVSQMENSLMYTLESETHPAGVDRVESIEAGVRFAQQYYAEYNMAPTFDECLDNFCKANNIEATEAIIQTVDEFYSAPEQGPYNVSFQGKDVTVKQNGGGLLKQKVEICKKEGTSSVYEVKLKGSGKVVDVINSIRPGTIVEINGIEYKIP